MLDVAVRGAFRGAVVMLTVLGHGACPGIERDMMVV